MSLAAVPTAAVSATVKGHQVITEPGYDPGPDYFGLPVQVGDLRLDVELANGEQVSVYYRGGADGA